MREPECMRRQAEGARAEAGCRPGGAAACFAAALRSACVRHGTTFHAWLMSPQQAMVAALSVRLRLRWRVWASLELLKHVRPSCAPLHARPVELRVWPAKLLLSKLQGKGRQGLLGKQDCASRWVQRPRLCCPLGRRRHPTWNRAIS